MIPALPRGAEIYRALGEQNRAMWGHRAASVIDNGYQKYRVRGASPGARMALVKTLHPDAGSGGSTATRAEIFQTLMAVMERLGIRG